MVESVNTNRGAAVALQQLSKSNSVLDQIRERTASGNKVNGPKDDAAIFAIAKQLEGELAGAAAVQVNLAFGEAATSTAINAGTEVSDLLVQAKGLAVQASQEGLDDASRQALETEFNALTEQINTVVNTASFGGTNLVEPGAADLDLLASESGDTVTVAAADLSTTGLGIDSLSLSTSGGAQSAVAALDTALASTSSALGSFGSAAQHIEASSDFSTTLANSVKQGIGNLVDADLGEESARLLAGEVSQRLGIQSLSIANSAPRNIAALFE